VPGLDGRAVPRLLAIVPAGLVALALTGYGLLSVAVMVRSLVDGTMSGPEFVHGWAVASTLLVFCGWGVALGVTTVGYALTTRRHPTEAPVRMDQPMHAA
jgi:hypothetical protein